MKEWFGFDWLYTVQNECWLGDLRLRMLAVIKVDDVNEDKKSVAK